MRQFAIRLHKGDLLKQSIIDFCNKNNIKAGVIVSSVGSLLEVDIRNAGGKEIIKLNEALEIISLNGTVSINRIHLHISVSDKDLKCYGGHLIEGIINTTCELVILELDNYEFSKEFDESTGYNEIKINKSKDIIK